MKLIHYTLLRIALALFVIVSFWACIFFVYVIDEIDGAMDESLRIFKETIIRRKLTDENNTFSDNGIMNLYQLREIPREEAMQYKEQYLDTLIFFESALQYEPIRMLKSAFKGKDDSFYEVQVMTSTVEKDDMIATFLKQISFLYIVLLLSIVITIYYIFNKSLAPLYKLLDWLNVYTLGRKNEALPKTTPIEEFTILNRAVIQMRNRNEEVFEQQKEFLENASHELQTPLAIVMNKLEYLAQSPDCTEEQMKEMFEMHETLQRSVKLNKTLLLLCRIENGQFHNTVAINVNSSIKQVAKNLEEIYEYKNVKVEIEENACIIWQMDETLAQILVTNLIKNAMVHNVQDGLLRVTINEHQIIFANAGDPVSLDEEKLFKRFSFAGKRKRESTGLGLSIIKSICSVYQVDIKYQYVDNMHMFILNF